MNFRDSLISISNSTRWKLTRIVRSQSSSGLDTPETVDGLAEKVLRDWITVRYPKLDELWKEREAIDNKEFGQDDEQPLPF